MRRNGKWKYFGIMHIITMHYKDKDYKSEARQVDSLLRKYGNNVKRIINFGCGTGKHDIELAGMGYQCMGIDMSRMMVDIAEDNAAGNGKRENICFSVADIRNYKPNKQFDAVISLFHVMSYQNTNSDIMSAFRSARAALGNGGIFLFDVWYGPGVLSDKPTLRVKEVEDDRYKLIRIARPAMYDTTNIVDVCYEIFIIDKQTGETKTINETHSMRYFFRPELEFYLKETGFELIDNLDSTTLGATSYGSWTSYFVAKAV